MRATAWCCLLLLLVACNAHDQPVASKTVDTAPPPVAPASPPVPAAGTTPATASQAAAAVEAGSQGTLAEEGPARAVAELQSASGSSVTGTVTFTKQADGVEVSVRLANLAAGRHAFHVHEMGDCSAHDGESAGAHFNPDGKRHGDRLATERHVGDLGNVTADDTGKVELSFTDAVIALSGPNSIVGRAVMVHADPDDGTSQPAGNAGARIACGVITAQP